MILSNNLLPEERRWVWEQARLHADEIHQTHVTHPPGAEAVPEQEPHRDYNTSGGILARDRFLTCLLAGFCKAALKAVNYNKLSEVIQDMKENPSAFLERLTKALLQLRPSNHRRWTVTHDSFFSLSATMTLRLNLDIWGRPLDSTGGSLRVGF